MKRYIHIPKWAASTSAICALALCATQQSSATGIGQLGILDTSTINPATGVEWVPGNTYHLAFITTNTTDATSTSIADYNSFVQTEANNAGYGSVNWFAFGSTATTDALDNVVITASVMNVNDSAAIAQDAADFYDLQNMSPVTDLSGGNANVWSGTVQGGTASGTQQLGATNVRNYWSGWDQWDNPQVNLNSATDTLAMFAVSEQLTVVPEASAAWLIGLAGLGLLARRRR